MADVATVRRLAMALPGASDASAPDRIAFEVEGKGFAWTWLMRVNPKKARTPQITVLAVRCSIERREMLIDAAPQIYFIDDHYRGYPAVLVRLDAVEIDELEALLKSAWRMVAPKGLVAANPEI